MKEERPKRFFVTIMAPDAKRLRQVADLGLDLFAESAAQSDYRVDGLITLEEVGKLVEAGYRVLVGDTDRPRRTHEFIGFDEWRAELLNDLEKQRKGD